jgi:hypothetical protein
VELDQFMNQGKTNASAFVGSAARIGNAVKAIE